MNDELFLFKKSILIHIKKIIHSFTLGSFKKHLKFQKIINITSFS